MDLGSALDGSGEVHYRCYWLQLHCVSELLIPGPLDDLGLFGSSSLVPKQRAVTSTGAYVLMDLGSVNLGRFVVSGLCTGPFVCLPPLARGHSGKHQAASFKPQASSIKLDSQENVGYKI